MGVNMAGSSISLLLTAPPGRAVPSWCQTPRFRMVGMASPKCSAHFLEPPFMLRWCWETLWVVSLKIWFLTKS